MGNEYEGGYGPYLSQYLAQYLVQDRKTLSEQLWRASVEDQEAAAALKDATEKVTKEEIERAEQGALEVLRFGEETTNEWWGESEEDKQCGASYEEISQGIRAVNINEGAQVEPPKNAMEKFYQDLFDAWVRDSVSRGVDGRFLFTPPDPEDTRVSVREDKSGFDVVFPVVLCGEPETITFDQLTMRKKTLCGDCSNYSLLYQRCKHEMGTKESNTECTNGKFEE